MLPSSNGPELVLADPPSQLSADSFWQVHCKRLPPERIQFIGLDLDFWFDSSCSWDDVADWARDLRKYLATRSQPGRLFVTTIIALIWPRKTTFDNFDSSRPVVSAGANLRLKREPFYRRTDRVELGEFHRDLTDAGLLRPADHRPPPAEYPAPRFDTPEEADEYRQRLEFYGAPPFRWHPDDLNALFGAKPTTP